MSKVAYFNINPKTKKPAGVVFLEEGEQDPDNATTDDPYETFIDPFWDGKKWSGTKTYAEHNANVEKNVKQSKDDEEIWRAEMTQKIMMLEAGKDNKED